MTTFQTIEFAQALNLSLDVARERYEAAKSAGEGAFATGFDYRRTVYGLKEAIEIGERTAKAPKTYSIYYIIKANGNKSVHCMTVTAGNVKDAKTIVRYAVQDRTQHNAFTMTNNKLPNGWDWSNVARLNGTTVDEIKAQANNGGYVFA